VIPKFLSKFNNNFFRALHYLKMRTQTDFFLEKQFSLFSSSLHCFRYDEIAYTIFHKEKKQFKIVYVSSSFLFFVPSEHILYFFRFTNIVREKIIFTKSFLFDKRAISFCSPQQFTEESNDLHT
jgi:hypothetical protein